MEHETAPEQLLYSPIRNVVVVSDLHCGSRLGLCPRNGITLDEEGHYGPSKLQKIMHDYWDAFWEWALDDACRGEPFILAVNGDAVDGNPFNSTVQVSNSPTDQLHIAEEMLQPIVNRAALYFQIKGTEVHVGKAGMVEELLATTLKAEPNSIGQRARYELRLQVGDRILQLMHHIGTTGSTHFESTAVLKEFTSSLQHAARWDCQPPNIIGRSHRHIHCEVRIPTAQGYGISFVTPGWQLKTPFVWRIPGGRLSLPQFGGSVIRLGDQDFYTRHWVKVIDSTETVIAQVPIADAPQGDGS